MRFADPANHETTGCASYPHKIAMSQQLEVGHPSGLDYWSGKTFDSFNIGAAGKIRMGNNAQRSGSGIDRLLSLLVKGYRGPSFVQFRHQGVATKSEVRHHCDGNQDH
jgi:hypothetical protein